MDTKGDERRIRRQVSGVTNTGDSHRSPASVLSPELRTQKCLLSVPCSCALFTSLTTENWSQSASKTVHGHIRTDVEDRKSQSDSQSRGFSSVVVSRCFPSSCLLPISSVVTVADTDSHWRDAAIFF